MYGIGALCRLIGPHAHASHLAGRDKQSAASSEKENSTKIKRSSSQEPPPPPLGENPRSQSREPPGAGAGAGTGEIRSGGGRSRGGVRGSTASAEVAAPDVAARLDTANKRGASIAQRQRTERLARLELSPSDLGVTLPTDNVDVYVSGGAEAQPTDWREALVAPHLEAASLSYYMGNEDSPAVHKGGERVKHSAKAVLHVLDGSLRGMEEAAELLGSRDCVFIVTSNRGTADEAVRTGQNQLAKMVQQGGSNCSVYASIDDALEAIVTARTFTRGRDLRVCSRPVSLLPAGIPHK
jgi:hypothetical protein